METHQQEEPAHCYTVVLVEDDQEISNHLASTLDAHSQFELLGCANTMVSGIATLNQYKPDILLVDIGLPDGSGVEVIKEVYRQCLDCEAMVISGFQDENLVFKALEAGAKGYLLKHDSSQKITEALLTMMKGGAPVSPIIARLMLNRFSAPDLKESLPEKLTERQQRILELVCHGFSSQEIAEKLDITYYTVTTHIKNIYGKLQVNSRSEAIHEALRLGLFRT